MNLPLNPRANLQGAIDLGALAAAREAQQRAALAPKTKNSYVIDVDMSNFEADVIQQSMTVPVVVDLWAQRCEPCKQLSPILEKLAADYAGRFVLAKIDIDANPELSQAFQVQSIPMVLAFVGGQPLGLFQGALPEVQIRPVIDQVLAAAAQAGVSGIAVASESTESDKDPASESLSETHDEAPSDPRFDAAETAIEAGDWDSAIAAYKVILKDAPKDPVARIGMLNVELMKRTDDMDFESVLASTDDSCESQLKRADALFLMNDYDESFACIIEIVRANIGDQRSLAQERLLALFDIAGTSHPSVTKARLALSNALF